ESRDREFVEDLLLLFLGEFDDVDVGLNFQLADGRNRDTCGKGDDVEQAILQLSAKIGPTTVAALEVHAQCFKNSREIGIGGGGRGAETDTGTIGNFRDGGDAAG